MSHLRPLLLLLSLMLAACGGPEPTPATPPPTVPAPPPAGPLDFDKAADFVGRWSNRGGRVMWVVMREDGRYRYSGTSDPGSDPKLGGRPPWMNAHTGTWQFEDGTLELQADDESNRPLLPFEFDLSERSLNLRVIGYSPAGREWIVFFKETH